MRTKRWSPADIGVVNLSVLAAGSFTTNLVELEGARWAVFRFWGLTTTTGAFAANPTINAIVSGGDVTYYLNASGGGAEMGAAYTGYVQAASLSNPANARVLTVPLLARGTIITGFPWHKYGLTVTCTNQNFTNIYGDCFAMFDGD